MEDWFADQFDTLGAGAVLLRLGAAVVLGALVGMEREVRDKPAGLRTFALVSLGAASFVLSVIQADLSFVEENWEVQFDPTRLVTAIATGIGFLGAGAIFRTEREVRGLTTGAGIWIAGAVGVACGVGEILVAGVVTVLALAILVALRVLERILL